MQKIKKMSRSNSMLKHILAIIERATQLVKGRIIKKGARSIGEVQSVNNEQCLNESDSYEIVLHQEILHESVNNTLAGVYAEIKANGLDIRSNDNLLVASYWELVELRELVFVEENSSKNQIEKLTAKLQYERDKFIEL